MKTYRRHYCMSQHRSLRTLAKCMFSRAAWVSGEGQYAVLAWCRVLTVMRYPDLDAAQASKTLVDQTQCGGGCYGRHEIVRLDLDNQVEHA